MRMRRLIKYIIKISIRFRVRPARYLAASRNEMKWNFESRSRNRTVSVNRPKRSHGSDHSSFVRLLYTFSILIVSHQRDTVTQTLNEAKEAREGLTKPAAEENRLWPYTL